MGPCWRDNLCTNARGDPAGKGCTRAAAARRGGARRNRECRPRVHARRVTKMGLRRWSTHARTLVTSVHYLTVSRVNVRIYIYMCTYIHAYTHPFFPSHRARERKSVVRRCMGRTRECVGSAAWPGPMNGAYVHARIK